MLLRANLPTFSTKQRDFFCSEAGRVPPWNTKITWNAPRWRKRLLHRRVEVWNWAEHCHFIFKLSCLKALDKDLHYYVCIWWKILVKMILTTFLGFYRSAFFYIKLHSAVTVVYCDSRIWLGKVAVPVEDTHSKIHLAYAIAVSVITNILRQSVLESFKDLYKYCK